MCRYVHEMVLPPQENPWESWRECVWDICVGCTKKCTKDCFYVHCDLAVTTLGNLSELRIGKIWYWFKIRDIFKPLYIYQFHFSQMNFKLRKNHKLFVYRGFENTDMKVAYIQISISVNYQVDIYHFLLCQKISKSIKKHRLFVFRGCIWIQMSVMG